MTSLFAEKIDTPTHRLRQSNPETVAAFIRAVRKSLPLTILTNFAHRFLTDVGVQINDGYRKNLSPKQAGLLLRFADQAGVDFATFEKENTHAI